MGETTLTIDELTRERLDIHRADAHDSWDETLDSLMEVMPTPGDVREGCTNCDTELRWEGTVEDTGGCIVFFRAEYDDNTMYGSNYYCSAECAHEAQQEAQKYVPERPDRVLVGGKGEPQTGFGDASFYLDGEVREVSLNLPGAFAGTDSHGNEYDYFGEPVYVENEGQWVQSGVIEDIIHEESHTALLLGHDHETEMLLHPDEEKRADYRERHEKRESDECAVCGAEFSYPVKDAPEECPECGDEEW